MLVLTVWCNNCIWLCPYPHGFCYPVWIYGLWIKLQLQLQLPEALQFEVASEDDILENEANIPVHENITSDFYAEEEFILCVRDADCCWVSKVSCVGRVRKMFWVNLRGLSNFGEQLFWKIIWKFILNFRRTLVYIKEGKTSIRSTTDFKPFICYIVVV